MLSLARPQVDINNNPTGTTYTASQVDSALKSTPRRMFFRYVLLDSNNQFKRALTTVESGNVAYDTTLQIKRTAHFTVLDDGTINFLSDRIQPFALLGMGGGYFAQFPLGVFLLSTPPRQTDAALVATRQIDGYDQLQILVDEKTGDRYTSAAGANYIAEVQKLLTSAGITETNLTATSSTLPVAQDWPIGTPYLDIINALLKAINYRQLWFDENGVAIAMPYVTPDQRAPEYTYANDSQSVMYPQVQQSLDLFAQPNKWVATVTQTDRSVLVSTYTNQNANSPTSTVSRGRTIVKVDTSSNAPDQATLDAYVQQLAYQDSQVYEQVTLPTAIMPFHSDQDVYNVNFSPLGISSKYSEVSWSFDLVAGAQMTHVAQRVVSV